MMKTHILELNKRLKNSIRYICEINLKRKIWETIKSENLEDVQRALPEDIMTSDLIYKKLGRKNRKVLFIKTHYEKSFLVDKNDFFNGLYYSD